MTADINDAILLFTKILQNKPQNSLNHVSLDTPLLLNEKLYKIQSQNEGLVLVKKEDIITI